MWAKGAKAGERKESDAHTDVGRNGENYLVCIRKKTKKKKN